MFISQQRRKENVAEYLLYMWQIEDIIRANNFSIEEIEKNQGFDVLIAQINNILEMSENNNLIVQYIKDRLPEKCIVFIVGLGKTYPIIRAHKILNTMHQVLDKNPVVLFYPGNYDEKSLRAFGEVKDQNYYRAFRLD